MGWKMLPVLRPVADQFAVLCRSGSGKICDPGINPSDRIGDICTIRGDFVTHEKIFRNIFINPFSKLIFFFNRPPVITDFPDLIRGFIDHLAEAWGGDKDNQKESEKVIEDPFRANDVIVYLH
jgi:hypothetical protein